MDDLIKLLITSSRSFFPKLILITLHPKTIISYIPDSERNTGDAATYCVIACLFSSILWISLLVSSVGEWAQLVFCMFIILFGSTFLCGVAMHFSWMICGQTTKKSDINIIYLYHSGTFNVLASASIAIGIAIVAILGKYSVLDAYYQSITLQGMIELKAQSPLIHYTMLIFSTIVCLLIYGLWGIGAWIAYSNALSANFVRSVFALIIFTFIGLFVVLSFHFMYVVIILNIEA